MRVIVTGATGFVGVPLVAALQARGDEVIALVRDVDRARVRLPDVKLVRADLETPGLWWDELSRADAIVNLAGESIGGGRWDARRKQLLRDSRVETTRNLVEAIARAAPRPRVLISASGIDYYPFAVDLTDFDDDEVTERDPPGEEFLARLCKSWEAEALGAKAHGVRVAVMRTGHVLGDGGVLARMATPFKLFAGGRIGSGRQWMPWIHRDDVVAAYATALVDDRYEGPINLVTDSTRNAEFARALGTSLKRPSWMPVPAFALRLAVGELAEALLHGRRVVPTRLRELGFTWRHPELAEAMRAS